MNRQTILIIEDERAIADALAYNLEKEGFEVANAYDGVEGVRKAQAMLPDLILLDLMLPQMDGVQVCRALRSEMKTEAIKIIMLTAKSEEVDEIVGFSMGADDYVTKPFKIKPLISRIKARLREPAIFEGQGLDQVKCQGITVDRLNHRALLNQEELILTPTEFRLLWTLVRQAGRPFRRNELMDTCRGEDANALERTIDVHIRSLRQKLGEKSEIIETVRGVGYRLKPD